MTQSTRVLIEIEWCDSGDEPTAEGDWLRNGVLPQVDEVRWTISIFRKALQVGDRAWFTFEPGAAVFNELSDEPAHMDRAAVVEVEILQRQLLTTVIYSDGSSLPDRDWSWIQVRCLRVIPLWDIPNHFEETSPYHFEVNADLQYRHPIPVKVAEADKIMAYGATREAYHSTYYLTKTTPPRAVLHTFYFSVGETEHVIVNSAFELPNSN